MVNVDLRDPKTLKAIKHLVTKTKMPQKQIALMLGVPLSSLRHICSEYSMGNIKYINKKEHEQIVKMSKQKIPLTEIAVKINRCPSSISRYCKKHNLTYHMVPKPSQSSIDKLIDILKKTPISTHAASKMFPEFTPRMVGYYKIKYGVKGVTRGGVRTIDMKELAEIKRLAKKGYSYRQMSVDLSQKYNRLMSEELIRGRIRQYHIPYKPLYTNRWTEKEMDMLKRLYRDIGFSQQLFKYYQATLPNRSYESIKKRINICDLIGGN